MVSPTIRFHTANNIENSEVESNKIAEGLENLKLNDDLSVHDDIGILLPSEVSSIESDEELEETDATSDNEMTTQNGSEDYEVDDPDISIIDISDSFTTDEPTTSLSSFNESQNHIEEISTRNTENKNFVDVKEKPDLKGRPSSCVFVASLAATLTDDELCVSVTKRFKDFGNLNGVKVLRDLKNRPYAFVQYTNDHDANKALFKAHGSTLDGRIIRCEAARVNRTLFIDCQLSVSFKEINNFCKKFGELEQVIPSNNQSGVDIDKLNCRNFTCTSIKSQLWFIQFAYRDDAIRTFANINTELDWNVEWAQNIKVPRKFNLLNYNDNKLNFENNKYSNSYDKRENRHNVFNANKRLYEKNKFSIDRKSIFVGQLPQETNHETLSTHFSSHGKINDIKLFHKPMNVFAFIEFENEESAAAALEKKNHSIFLNKTIHVQYKEVSPTHYVRRELRTSNPCNPKKKIKNLDGSQLNLAPPPINVCRRKSYDSVLPVAPQHIMPPTILSNPNYNNYASDYNSFHQQDPFQSYWKSAISPGASTDNDNKKQIKRFQSQDGDTNDYDSESGMSDHDNSNDESSSKKNTNNHATNENSIDYKFEMSGPTDGRSFFTTPSTTSYGASSGGNNIHENPYVKNRRYSYPLNPYYFPQSYYYPSLPVPMCPAPSDAPHSAMRNQPFVMLYPYSPPALRMDKFSGNGSETPSTGGTTTGNVNILPSPMFSPNSLPLPNVNINTQPNMVPIQSIPRSFNFVPSYQDNSEYKKDIKQKYKYYPNKKFSSFKPINTAMVREEASENEAECLEY